MGKRKNRSKRSTARLPKGLPVRDIDHNPFETTHKLKKPKFQIVNRNVPWSKPRTSALSEALQKRRSALNASLSKKSNQIVDKRIGEYNSGMSKDEQNLRRLVKERSKISKRSTKYSLNDEDDVQLTHRGQALSEGTSANYVGEDDVDDDNNSAGALDVLDTELHFGGLGDNAELSMYGGGKSTMAESYLLKKQELDDKIKMHKLNKLERQQTKESQVEKFEELDKSFAELSGLLQFRDKEQEIREDLERKRNKTLTQEELELADWDVEMKSYLYSSQKVRATDRTKTAEEVAKEEFERLHELETRRLARMNGDFEHDDLSDIVPTVERLDNESDEESADEPQEQIRFTADGLMRINSDGVVIGKVGENDDKKDVAAGGTNYQVGDKVTASYRAEEQYDGNESWFGGKVAVIHGDNTYDIEYDDGDYEEHVKLEYIREAEIPQEELEAEETKKREQLVLKQKRIMAKEKARYVHTIWMLFWY